MADEVGGGASPTTDPAAGTSAATDVSLREFVGASVRALDRHMTAELASLRRETETATKNAEKAIEVAAQEAKERLQAHNGLIEQNRQREESNRLQQEKAAGVFVSKEVLEALEKAQDDRMTRIEKFHWTLTGGLLFASAIGIANLVKIWTG